MLMVLSPGGVEDRNFWMLVRDTRSNSRTTPNDPRFERNNSVELSAERGGFRVGNRKVPGVQRENHGLFQLKLDEDHEED